MCHIWTRKQWKEATSRNDGEFTLTGIFANAAGGTALQVTEDDGWVYNVYDESGRDYTMHRSTESASKDMNRRGFTTPVVLIQGKTLAEWKEEGNLNETRDEHVHPSAPEGEPTEDEMDAYVNSLTRDEAAFAFMSLLVGDVTASVGA